MAEIGKVASHESAKERILNEYELSTPTRHTATRPVRDLNGPGLIKESHCPPMATGEAPFLIPWDVEAPDARTHP